jgi:cell wall-associated NlpC family hydrolase
VSNAMNRERLGIALGLAMGYVAAGIPYHWTTHSPADTPLLGFNCSGLISELLRATGDIDPYETLSTRQLAERFSRDALPAGTPIKAGDILLYGKDDEYYHAAIARSKDYIIEAGGGTLPIGDRHSAAVRKAFVRVRPFAMRADEFKVALRLWP